MRSVRFVVGVQTVSVVVAVVLLAEVAQGITLQEYAQAHPLRLFIAAKGAVMPNSIDQTNNLQENDRALLLSGQGLTDITGISTLIVEDDGKQVPLTAVKNLHIFLNKNQIASIPEEIRELDHVVFLYFEYNRLDDLPRALQEMDDLVGMYFTANEFTAVPPFVFEMRRLKKLQFSKNQISVLPPEIGNLTELRHFNMAGNHIAVIPATISKLTKLRVCDLSDNQISQLPPEFGEVPIVNQLRVRNNPLTDLPRGFASMRATIDITGTRIEIAQLPPELQGKINTEKPPGSKDEANIIVRQPPRAETSAGSGVRDAQAEEAWLRHGLTAAQRENIRRALQRGIEQKFVPGGALLIVHRGEPIFREGFGVASLETRQPFTIDAPCRIASVTKPHTATLMAMLVERGKLSWDDPVEKYIPAFAGIAVRDRGPATRSPRIRELLSHTAGFPGQPAIDAGKWKIKTDGTLADAVADLPAQGLASQPGTVYAYTGLGYLVAGRIAELVTGQEYGALMKEMLLTPIGAATATFYPSQELKARMPTMYQRSAGELVKVDVASRPRANAAYPNPAGSLVSTLDDVARLLLLHRNRGQVNGQQLVTPETLAVLYQRQPATGRTGYGLGFNVLKSNAQGEGVRVRHTGASGTFAQLDFENDLIVVLLTQVPQLQTEPFRTGVLKAIGDVFPASGRK